jgi:3-hydroxyethyl bacteriochlorophyllide a dehydrogenase
MKTDAIVLEKPKKLALHHLDLFDPDPDADSIVVETHFSGISSGTERLLWNGEMPAFPGMGYPLVPGYESVGQVVEPAARGKLRKGDTVFVPGANCYGDVRGLFGGAASRVVVREDRVVPVPASLGRESILLALAATAYHATARAGGRPPELIVGHGVLGRLLARIAVLGGGRPVVWERNAARRDGAIGYDVISPDDDDRDYESVYDVSGDAGILDTLVGRLRRGGEIVLAGFYRDAMSFAFAPAFSREARIRVSAEWQQPDLLAVRELTASRRLSLDGLITHSAAAEEAESAYPIAFEDPDCLKMVLDWRAAR